MKRKGAFALTRIISALLCLVMVLGLSSCFLFGNDETIIVNTEINENGELIIYYADGTTQNAGKIEYSETNIVIEEGVESITAATTKGIMSAVSITANFQSKTQSYIPGFGIIGGSGNKYYSRGSGVIYRISGDEALIITNHHVVYDSGSTNNGISNEIYLYLYGREDDAYAIPAQYVGGSSYYDIAVLYAKDVAFTSGSVAAVEVSEGEVSVGQQAIAVGNPQGYGISASLGIVSVESEYISTGAGSPATRAIRVDTAVNAGNSGGGLYNSSGKLIGIVNAKIVDESVENIGYAIPSYVAVGVAENIIKNCLGTDRKTVRRAVLGVSLGASDNCAVVNEKGELELVETVRVTGIERGSLAEGVLSKGDILISASVNGRSIQITRTHHLIDMMLYASVGDTVNVTVKRSGEVIEKSFTVTESSISEY